MSRSDLMRVDREYKQLLKQLSENSGISIPALTRIAAKEKSMIPESLPFKKKSKKTILGDLTEMFK